MVCCTRSGRRAVGTTISSRRLPTHRSSTSHSTRHPHPAPCPPRRPIPRAHCRRTDTTLTRDIPLQPLERQTRHVLPPQFLLHPRPRLSPHSHCIRISIQPPCTQHKGTQPRLCRRQHSSQLCHPNADTTRWSRSQDGRRDSRHATDDGPSEAIHKSEPVQRRCGRFFWDTSSEL